MNLPTLITDNITELLVKIVEFTQTRQKILTQNINNVHNHGFIPEDLEVNEFSEMLNNAINEHVRNQRLIFRDIKSIKFGIGGSFDIKPVVDEYAKKLLKNNQEEYLELQINKLLENSLNQRIATTLLRQKQGMASSFE